MSPGSPVPQLKPPSLHRGVTGPESGWGADCSSSHCPLLASCPLLTPLMRLDLAPCGTLASCPPGASAGPGALAAVPATHQNHKQTLLPRNTASPQHSRAGGIMGPEPEALAGHHRLCNPFISQTGRLRLTEPASVLLKFTQVIAPDLMHSRACVFSPLCGFCTVLGTRVAPGMLLPSIVNSQPLGASHRHLSLRVRSTQ